MYQALQEDHEEDDVEVQGEGGNSVDAPWLGEAWSPPTLASVEEVTAAPEYVNPEYAAIYEQAAKEFDYDNIGGQEASKGQARRRPRKLMPWRQKCHDRRCGGCDQASSHFHGHP